MDRKLIESLRGFRSRVNKDIAIEKLILFGSRATSNYRKDSDVDLIIVSKKFKTMDFFQRGARMYDYWSLDYPVDFLCYTPEEFAQKSKQISIIREALKNGVVVS